MTIRYAVTHEDVDDDFDPEEIRAKGAWPKTIEAAIKESARKYRWIANYIRKNPKRPAPLSHSGSCALCQLFLEKNGVCDGCPVFKYTGQKECLGSPWEHYDNYTEDGEPFLNNHALAYAVAEETFLLGLLKR